MIHNTDSGIQNDGGSLIRSSTIRMYIHTDHMMNPIFLFENWQPIQSTQVLQFPELKDDDDLGIHRHVGWAA